MRNEEPFAIPDKIIERLIELFEQARDSQFEIGDLLNKLIDSQPDSKAKIINYLAGHLQVSASTLYDYARIAALWTPEHRQTYQALDWTIYRNTDPNKPEDRDLLDLCIDEGWNASRLKREKFPDTEDSLIQSLLSLTNRFKSSNFTDLQNVADKILLIIEQYELIKSVSSVLDEPADRLYPSFPRRKR